LLPDSGSKDLRVLLIDNYDSFTFNLFQLISSLGVDVQVYRNDQLDIGQVKYLAADAICLSPGPKTPAASGICPEIVRSLAEEIPILGVCLGMQVINEVYGGKTIKAPAPVHGKTDLITNRGVGPFKGLPTSFNVARYHSLICEIVSPDLEILAVNNDNIPMAFQHKKHPLFGVQFHPESFLSEYGAELTGNFFDMVRTWHTNG
jgi:anthranilate synthase component 2